MFTLDRVSCAQWLPVNVHNTKIFFSSPATGHGSNKLSPYLREEVVKRMKVHVADALEKGLKPIMFPTRDTALVTVSSNCFSRCSCEETFGVLRQEQERS